MEHYAATTGSVFFSRTGCCHDISRGLRRIPVGFKTELVVLFKLAWPMCISQMLTFLVSFVSTVFCGHLGKTELAGVVLAIGAINVTGISIGAGLSSACDTLISQTFGSGNVLQVGLVVQRAILILLLACLPCWALLVNTELILLAVRQSPEVARLSQTYVKIFMPALPASFMYSLEVRYLQNQAIIWPTVITGVVVNIINALINYILLYVLDMGVAGSAIANAVSQFAMAGILFLYIWRRGLYKATWSGWSRECLTEWGAFMGLAIPSMIMLCVEWWTYEMGSFLAVEADAVYRASQFPLGFGVAGSVRVGNALGAGDTEQAKLSAKLTILCSVLISSCLSVVIAILKDRISYMFTYDEEIRLRAAEVVALYAPFLILDALALSAGSIVRGAGRQRVGALCGILGYYGVGFPIGVSLMFPAKLGIKGLWLGLLVCVALQSTFLLGYLFRMDWQKVTVEAQVRAGVLGNVPETIPSAPGGEEGPPGREEDSQLFRGRATEEEEDPAAPPLRPAPPRPSLPRLLLRRGPALGAMLAILLTGILTDWLIPRTVT
ncbi:unnamed protein product [Gadus morhua 'NCC']